MRCLGSLLYVDLHVNTVKQMGHLLHELLTNLALYMRVVQKVSRKVMLCLAGWILSMKLYLMVLSYQAHEKNNLTKIQITPDTIKCERLLKGSSRVSQPNLIVIS